MTTNYRYVHKTKSRESQFNIHVREMIEMIKNEEVKENLYIKGVKLSNHALKRVDNYFNISNPATATRMIKDMLGKAKRIGDVLAFDGRINVLYAYNKIAIYLSPNLKTVVTVNKYEERAYQPIADKLTQTLDKESMIELHLEYLRNIEELERSQSQKMLNMEARVSEAKSQYTTILSVGRGVDRKRKVKDMISEQNHLLKQEGWKLFNIKIEKRQVCKAIASLT